MTETAPRWIAPISRFGAMRITGDGIWGEPANRAEAIRVLRCAVEVGIDFIDSADSYGPRVSEEIIAEALRPYPAGLVIATQGGSPVMLPIPGTSNLEHLDENVPAAGVSIDQNTIRELGEMAHVS